MAYNKYRNKQVVIDGMPFPSKREADRYSELKLLYMAGEITGLKLQPVYELIPAIKKHRAIKYKADFEYTDKAGNFIVEDVKGCKTKVYKIKKKLFARKYGFDITET